MSVTWLDVKNQVRAYMDELSSRGTLLAYVKVADIILKMQKFANQALMEVASTTAKLPAEQNIVLNPVCNELSKDTSAIKKFTGTDYLITLVNARACFFEMTYPGTAVIEESSDNGVNYSTIETITAAATPTDFVEYRRLINPSLSTNLIRLRFTGTYPFDYRNFILYSYQFPDQASVQQHRPWFEYDLPSDWLKKNVVLSKSDTRQFTPLSTGSYMFTDDKKIIVNRYISPVEIKNLYWRKPTLLTFTGVDATDDAQVLDVADYAEQMIYLKIAEITLKSEKDETAGVIAENAFEKAMARLPGNAGDYQANILSINGW